MLLHLSDIHIGTEQPAVMAAVLQLADQRRDQIEAVLVSGDLTQRARASQFAGALTFLQQFDLPYLVIPGNHDIPLFDFTRRLFNPFQLYMDTFGEPEQVLETEHFYLVGINAVTRHNHTQGSITPLQIWQIGEKLRQAPPGKHRIALSHQPYAVLKPEEKADIPRLAGSAVRHWADCGLDMLLHGHFHQPSLISLEQHFRLSQEVYAVQAGTGLSQRLRFGVPNSLNLIHPDQQVERWDFDAVSSTMISKGMLAVQQPLP